VRKARPAAIALGAAEAGGEEGHGRDREQGPDRDRLAREVFVPDRRGDEIRDQGDEYPGRDDQRDAGVAGKREQPQAERDDAGPQPLGQHVPMLVPAFAYA
jgi:hypothetical protein